MGQVTEERMTGGIQGNFTWLEGGLHDLLCIIYTINHIYIYIYIYHIVYIIYTCIIMMFHCFL